MARQFAFLRAINVGSHTVRMERLRELFTELGLSDVDTFIASGNVIFDGGRRSARALERDLARHLAASLGYDVATFIRDSEELTQCLEHARVQQPADRDIQYVGFLHAKPDVRARRSVELLEDEVNEFAFAGREVYWLRRGGAKSPYSGMSIEKALGVPTTLRSMNTIVRMAARYCE